MTDNVPDNGEKTETPQTTISIPPAKVAEKLVTSRDILFGEVARTTIGRRLSPLRKKRIGRKGPTAFVAATTSQTVAQAAPEVIPTRSEEPKSTPRKCLALFAVPDGLIKSNMSWARENRQMTLVTILEEYLGSRATSAPIEALNRELVYYAYYQDKETILKCLLNLGADPNAESGAPLKLAFQESSLDNVRVLLRAKADPMVITEGELSETERYNGKIKIMAAEVRLAQNRLRGQQKLSSSPMAQAPAP